MLNANTVLKRLHEITGGTVSPLNMFKSEIYTLAREVVEKCAQVCRSNKENADSNDGYNACENCAIDILSLLERSDNADASLVEKVGALNWSQAPHKMALSSTMKVADFEVGPDHTITLIGDEEAIERLGALLAGRSAAKSSHL